ncbi:hypothetical protein Tco_1124685 [Tanacetum coccineum]|uniref:Zinc finger, CCHC-type n=1 Tax=Tanacetum coccineum TaxID=301880 RepID=A0ABQ5J8I0_9ASTR
MVEVSSSKKFIVTDFNNYIMVGSRSVMEQYHELFQILGQYTQHGLFMDESISVSSIIDKLPPSWKDFKHMLKHNMDELSLVQLGSHFRIEETLKMEESGKKKSKDIVGSSSLNMVEDDKNKKNNKNFKGNKGKFHDKKDDSSLRWLIGSVANPVISRRIVGLKRTMVQALLDRDKEDDEIA